jgi:hypothetical protein
MNSQPFDIVPQIHETLFIVFHPLPLSFFSLYTFYWLILKFTAIFHCYLHSAFAFILWTYIFLVLKFLFGLFYYLFCRELLTFYLFQEFTFTSLRIVIIAILIPMFSNSNIWLFKISVFSLLSVSVTECHWLGYLWRNEIYLAHTFGSLRACQ